MTIVARVTCIVANMTGHFWANGYLFAYCHVAAGQLAPIACSIGGMICNGMAPHNMIIFCDSDTFETMHPSVSCCPSFPLVSKQDNGMYNSESDQH